MNDLYVGLVALIMLGAGVVIGRMLARNTPSDSASLELLLRAESERSNQLLRSELREMNQASSKTLTESLEGVSKAQQTHLEHFGKSITAMGDAVEKQLTSLQESNEKKLDQMRETVDEKLQSTLEKRLSESFKMVSERLEAVQRGLGEMQNLATDVGGLKKVLMNVSTRGAMGEIQAAQILESILHSSQYGRNVKTHPGCDGQVEFAIRLPGRDGDVDKPVWIPVDCKFTVEDHQRWIDSIDTGDKEEIKRATKAFVATVKAQAKKIRSKYVSPPDTTEFAIMFLPSEGLYADVARQPGMIETLQRDYHIVLAGPSNFAALLNSLLMGFRTLALEAQASHVWQVLSAVKTEFGKFGEHLNKLHRQLNTAANTIGGDDDSMQRRMRAMERKLREVDTMPDQDASRLLDVPENNLDGPSEE